MDGRAVCAGRIPGRPRTGFRPDRSRRRVQVHTATPLREPSPCSNNSGGRQFNALYISPVYLLL